ncbi:MAG: serine/threonine-protein kinase [Bacteroidota bacterium]
MTRAKDWAAVDQLFDRALDLPVGQRAEFVREVAGQDSDLRERLERLLEATEEGFTEGAQAIVDPLLPERPSTVGPFRLCETLGHGGMGVVFRAERNREGSTQEVAVKMIRPDLFPLASADTLRRFAQERAVLSRLEHPHIARFIDGGETSEGTPFLVMEYVHGVPITAFCVEEALPLRERIQLIQVIAQAVAFAHRQLVVHRDLKPSNLLIARGKEGAATPKVIDFGIAKLLTPTVADVDTPLTATGIHLLTPEYAAPEQLGGGDVGIAADIYALGAILYEVLTGVRPFQAESREALERIVRHTPPTRPSLRLKESTKSQAGISQRHLRGDLDWICLRALRKDPEQRYRSASELADDLENYLQGRPVLARRPTLRYRASRFVRRNGVSLVVVVALLLTLLGGLGASLWQAHVATVERDRATAEARRAEEASAFLADLLALGDPFNAPTLTPPEALADTGLARLQRASTMDPMLKAAIACQLAEVFGGQGRFGLEEASARFAIEVLSGTNDPPPERLAEAYLAHSAPLRVLGRYEEAIVAARRAAHYDSASVQGTLFGDIAVELAIGLAESGQPDDAIEVAREALTTLESSVGADSLTLLYLLDTQAAALDAAGRIDEALVVGERAVAVSKAVRGTESAAAQIVPHNYALILISAKRYTEAYTVLSEVVRNEAIALGSNHPARAISQSNLADLELRTGRIRAAWERAAEAGEILVGVGGEGAAVSVRLVEAVALARLGRIVDADSLFRRVLAPGEQTLQPYDQADAEYLFGVFLYRTGQYRHGAVFRERAAQVLSPSDLDDLDGLFGGWRTAAGT